MVTGTKTTENKKAGSRPNRKRRPARAHREDQEFEQKIIDVARVTRVTEGGKRMTFRATVVIGDKINRVGVGMGKGVDVAIAVNKAVNQAKKKLFHVPVNKEGTIPHEAVYKFGAAKVMLKPAPQGTGIIAGGVVRLVLEVSGIQNITAKMFGSKNKINNSMAVIEALKSMKMRNVK